MDKNTFTGLFLIMLIMGASIYFMKPDEAAIKKEQARAHADSLKRAGKPALVAATAKFDTAKKATVVTDSAILKTPFGAATAGKEEFVTLENKDLRLKLSTKGGRVYSAELKDYKTWDKKPLILFNGEDNHFGLNFSAAGRNINTDDLFFTPSTTNLVVAGSDSSSVIMRLSYSPTQYVDYIYSLKGTGFKVGLTVKPVGLDQIINNNGAVTVNWASEPLKQEKDMNLERQYSSIYYNNFDGDNGEIGDTKDQEKSITEGKTQWLSFKQHFFSSVLISREGFTKVNLAVAHDTSDHTVIKHMKASAALTRSADGSYPLTLYYGPNKYNLLKDQGYDLQKQIGMGWGPLKYINRFAVLPVFNFLQQFGWNYGIIILALTIILKLVLSPLTYKSYLSMAKMRVLKPEMDEIKSKVGEDNPTLLQQEYLKLYKKAGVNPLGGCLPLLIQMPIVIAFFRFFPSLFELRGQSFLWMHDLSTYDSLITFAPLPIIGWTHISLMCLLMTISTLIYTYFNNQISGATGQMKYIGYITPIIFFGALNGYPAGLNYYYFLANMLTFAQQYLIKFMVDDKKIHAQIQENKKKPEDKKKKSGFGAKLEEMMRQQQQIQAKKK